MAKRKMSVLQRRYFGKRGSRRGTRLRSRRTSGSSFLGNGAITSFAFSAAYGASRGYIARKLEPLFSKIPLGNYADNAGMIAALLLAKKLIKNPMVSQFVDKGIIAEGVLIGSELVSTGFSLGNNSTSTAANGWQ